MSFFMKALLGCIITMGACTNAYAYKTDTHQDLTTAALSISSNYLQFLRDFKINYAIARGLTTYGSYAEDKEHRFVFHFYDPINHHGLGIPPLAFDSALVWAYQHDLPYNEYSWIEARNSMYQSLTNADKETRESHFRKLFRFLGHIVHLVEDMAQPSHVRNDPHSSHYESESAALLVNPSHLEDWALFHASAVIEFANSNVNPKDVVAFEDPFENLALFSNKNFFSDDTIFKNYVLPSYDQTNYEDSFIKYGILGEPTQVVAEDGQIYYVPYIYKTQGIPGGYKLAQVGYFGNQLADNPGVRELAFQVDDEVAKDNAQILVPQAVSYSAGMLDYFFRGNMEVTLTQGGFNVKNINNEAIEWGNISIYYDDLNLNRHSLASYWFFSPLSPGDETPVISFTRPVNNIKPGQYIVVFQGQLGAEEGAVIGKVTAPQKLYYISKRSGIYKIYGMNADGSNPSVIYDNPDPNITISKLAPSPDGKTLAFSVNGPRIFLLDLMTGGLTEFTEGDWPDWSPDGGTIVFERDVTPPEAFVQGGQLFSVIEIFSKNILTGNEQQLTHTYPPTGNTTAGSFNGHPAFSPDGQSIAYTRWPPDEADCTNPSSFVIYLMDAPGNSNQALTCDLQNAWLDAAATWSPDGKEIAFLRRWVEPYNRLFKVSVDTKTISPLTDSDGTVYSELTPAWSADGKYIAVGSNRDGDFDVWLVGSSGVGYLSNLTNSNSDIDGFPAYLK